MFPNLCQYGLNRVYQHRNNVDSHRIRTTMKWFDLLISMVWFICITEAATVSGIKEVNATDSPPTEQMCTTKVCRDKASQIYSWIDETVEPCDDFYQFACRGWKEQTENISYPSSAETIALKIKRQTQYLLESNITTPEPSTNRLISKMRKYYRNCVKFDSEDSRNHLNQLQHLLSQVPLPHINATGLGNMELEVLLAELDSLEVFIFFQPIIESRYENASLSSVVLDKPPTKYFKDNLKADGLKFRNRRKSLINEVLKKVYEDFNVTNVTIDAEAIFNLELLIADITIDNTTECCEMEYMHIGQFKSLMSNFDLGKYLNQLMSHQVPIRDLPPLRPLPNNFIITVVRLEYFRKVNNVVKDRHIKNTIGMLATFRLLEKFQDSLPTPYRNIFERHEQNLKEDNNTQRSMQCGDNIRENRFVDVLMRIYSQKYFDRAAKPKVEKIASYVKKAFLKRLERNTWIDKSLLDFVAKKVREITTLIGFPDRIYDATYLEKWYGWITVSDTGYLVDEIEYTKGHRISQYSKLWSVTNPNEEYDTMLQVYVSFNAYYNILTFPMGIFNTPIYHDGYPLYIKYGTQGSLMGSLMANTFRRTRDMLDWRGRLLDVFSNESYTSLGEAIQCLIDQYNNLTVPFEGINITVDGYKTRNKNIENNVGFMLGFEAYKLWVKESKRIDPQLPGLNYTSDQLYFISMAQRFCTKWRKLQTDQLDGFPPAIVRVNTGLSNYQKFQETFHCLPGNRMNAAEKCVVW